MPKLNRTPCNTGKDDDLDLLGDDVEAFSGSQADLEGAADNLFSFPPRPQLQQHMGVFQASMLEAMKSLRDEMHSVRKASEVEGLR